MKNSQVLEIFIDEITKIVPTDDKILLNTPKIEVGTKSAFQINISERKLFYLGLSQLKGENNE